MNKAFERFKALADRKKNVYDEDLIALVAEESTRAPPDRYELRLPERHLVEHGACRTPRVKLRIDGEERAAHGDGDGMVDACYKAIAQIDGPASRSSSATPSRRSPAAPTRRARCRAWSARTASR